MLSMAEVFDALSERRALLDPPVSMEPFAPIVALFRKAAAAGFRDHAAHRIDCMHSAERQGAVRMKIGYLDGFHVECLRFRTNHLPLAIRAWLPDERRGGVRPATLSEWLNTHSPAGCMQPMQQQAAAFALYRPEGIRAAVPDLRRELVRHTDVDLTRGGRSAAAAMGDTRGPARDASAGFGTHR